MSGWMVTWNGSQIDLGTGAWQVLNASSGMPTSGYTNGIGIFNWSGVYGDSYTLDYTATPQAGPFIGVQWALHLEGTVAPCARSLHLRHDAGRPRPGRDCCCQAQEASLTPTTLTTLQGGSK